MKNLLLILLNIILIFSLAGCSVEKVSTEKTRDIDFTVLEEENIPEELEKMIEEKRTQVFQMTYADKGALYIAKGYGEQSTSGYSIKVIECYETKNAVYIHTNLIGPAKEEKIVESKTYPYIVIKLEFVDKNVVFE